GRPDHLVWRWDSRHRAAARRMAPGRRAVIVGEVRTMAFHELRDKARLGIASAKAGTPVMIFQHGEPSAVLIAGDEVARWVAIEGSVSALPGLDVYPELADDTSSLGSLLAGAERPGGAAARRLAR